MNCDCDKLPDAFYLDCGPADFESRLKNVEAKNWTRLCECTTCGRLWTVDEWDKYSFQVAIKINAKVNWERHDSVALRKGLLLSERGGLSDDECVWAKCSQKCVIGVVYCIDHLWDIGARR